MAKKYNKIPRKKKKQLKKQNQIQNKISRAELLELESRERARQQRARAQRARYKKNISFLEDLGIPTSIISKSTSIKETQRRAQAYLQEKEKSARLIKQEHLYAKKINKLLDAGFSYDEASKIVGSTWKQKSHAEIDRIIYEKQNPINSSIRVDCSHYLYIGFAEKIDGFSTYDLNMYSDEELIHLINDRIRDARNNPDDSNAGNFKGIFQFGVFNTKEKAIRRAKYWNQHGYNLDYKHGALKLDNSRYSKITISNKFSYREFLEMTYTVIDQMLNWQVEQFIDTLKDFDRLCGTSFTKDFL